MKTQPSTGRVLSSAVGPSALQMQPSIVHQLSLPYQRRLHPFFSSSTSRQGRTLQRRLASLPLDVQDREASSSDNPNLAPDPKIVQLLRLHNKSPERSQSPETKRVLRNGNSIGRPKSPEHLRRVLDRQINASSAIAADTPSSIVSPFIPLTLPPHIQDHQHDRRGEEEAHGSTPCSSAQNQLQEEVAPAPHNVANSTESPSLQPHTTHHHTSLGSHSSHTQPLQQHLSSTTAETPSQESAEPSTASQPQEHQGGIPPPILVISLVSATLTMASCVFNTLLPIYMVTELKMSMRSMGMFEGLLEAFSYVVRMFSGVVSDMMTSRKSAITLGFAMGAMAKLGMSFAGSVGHLFAAKAVDRLANGVQAAPRDALISDLAPEATRSACFGFAQSMRKWGSAVGAVLAYFLMKASGNNYQLIFLLASGVSICSCIAFVLLVPSHSRKQTEQQIANSKAGIKESFSFSKFWKDVKSMGGDFYRMLAIISMYGMGHINESLLEARCIEVGFGKAESTLVVASLAFMIFLSAYPLGRLDDKFGPKVTFSIGMSALILGDLTLLMSGTHPMAVFAACLFLGVHWAVIQGPLLSIVVGLAPPNLRGTAFGIFYTVMAFTAVGANSMFGSVWHSFGANAAFGLSASLMVCALIALPMLLPNGDSKKAQPAAALA